MANHLDVAFNHNVQTSSLRRVSEILKAEAKLGDALWYGRKPPDDADLSDWDPDLVDRMRAGQRSVEAEHGVEWLDSHMGDDDKLLLGNALGKDLSPPLGPGHEMGHARQLTARLRSKIALGVAAVTTQAARVRWAPSSHL